MTKKEQYTRTREQLLVDLYNLLKNNTISLSFKFHHLRNDFLTHWTALDRSPKIGNPYWSKQALYMYMSKLKAGEKNPLKGIQHDHIVTKLWFEEIIIPILKDNEGVEGFEIPMKALEFLFKRLAIGAVVTAHQNQREIDRIKKYKYIKKRSGEFSGQVVQEESWTTRPRIFGMPINFMNKQHDFYLNPWVRYMEAEIEIFVIDWKNELSINNPTLNFNDFKFNENTLSQEERMGYEYWTDKLI